MAERDGHEARAAARGVAKLKQWATFATARDETGSVSGAFLDVVECHRQHRLLYRRWSEVNAEAALRFEVGAEEDVECTTEYIGGDVRECALLLHDPAAVVGNGPKILNE